MAWKIHQIFDRVLEYIVPEDGSIKARELGKDEFLVAVEQARAEWLAAKTYFDNVTDPDLVDHAIYSIEASERKYMYLLKRASALGYGIAPPRADEGEQQGPRAEVAVETPNHAT